MLLSGNILHAPFAYEQQADAKFCQAGRKSSSIVPLRKAVLHAEGLRDRYDGPYWSIIP